GVEVDLAREQSGAYDVAGADVRLEVDGVAEVPQTLCVEFAHDPALGESLRPDGDRLALLRPGPGASLTAGAPAQRCPGQPERSQSQQALADPGQCLPSVPLSYLSECGHSASVQVTRDTRRGGSSVEGLP